MRIAIVGAGIVGVTTAYELAVQGHDVTVFERHGTVAEEASFGSGGMLAVGWLAASRAAMGPPARTPALPWTATGRWLAAWRRAGSTTAWPPNRDRLLALATLSQARLHELVHDLRLACEHSQGALVLMRTEREVREMQGAREILAQAGIDHRWLTGGQARALEPALNPDIPLAAAMHLPGDGAGNCRQFALLLRRAAEALGAHFVFNARVSPLDRASPLRLNVSTATGRTEASFDAVVACAGAQANPLLRPVGLRLPLLAVHGQSLGAPMGEPVNTPTLSVIDAQRQVSITRLGHRLRIAGGAFPGEATGSPTPAAMAALYGTLRDWFPAGARLAGRCTTVQEWQGTRLLMPDGLPAIGATGIPGLWANLAHGNAGWLLACGSARVLAGQICGQAPVLDSTAFAPGRLNR